MKTRITIEIETSNLMSYTEDGEDLSEDQEREFHTQMDKHIEDFITDEDFQGNFMSDWIHDAEFLNPSAKRFSDIGDVAIRITRPE